MQGKKCITFQSLCLSKNFEACEKHLKALKPPILFLKSSFIEGVVKLSRNEEEIEKLKLIRDLLGNELQDHIVRVLHARKNMFVMTCPKAFLHFPLLRTLKELIVTPRICRAFCNESLLKSILYQSMYCLYKLHSYCVNFTHNDLKAENILLERCESSLFHYEQFGRIYTRGIRVVFIDTESVTGKNFPCSLLETLSKDQQREFGMEPEAPWCPFTDLHLLFFEILFACRTSSPSWGPRFAKFLETSAIPLKYFRVPYITKENRLNSEGKQSLNSLPLNIPEILSSPYFDELRVKELLD